MNRKDVLALAPPIALGLSLGVGAVTSILSCRASMPLGVGVSAPRAPEHAAPSDPDAAAEAPPVPVDFRSRMIRLTGRLLSRGHGEAFDAVVWANASAQPFASGFADAAAGTDVAPPDGAMLIEEAVTREPQGDREAGWLVMVRRSGAWKFDAVAPDGTLAGRARVVACETCHGDAKNAVFPIEQQP